MQQQIFRTEKESTANTLKKTFQAKVSFVDNRSVAQKQKQLCESMQCGTIQRFNIGWVPFAPGVYRGTTNIAGFGPATNGGAPFNGGMRTLVEANNIANFPGVAPVLPVGNYPRSDVGGGALLTYAISGNITPELDHIIPVNEGGANDGQNARLISKLQNNAPGLPRPHAPYGGGGVGTAGGAILRLYTPVNIIASHYGGAIGPIASGTYLNFAQTRSLVRHATGHLLAGWQGITAADIVGIQGSAPGNNNGEHII